MKQTDKIISSIRKSCANTTLAIGMARFHRKDHLVTHEINTSKNATSDAGTYTKQLIQQKTGSYAELSEVVNEARKFHEEMTSPTKMRGVRLISAKNYMDYVEGIRERQDKFSEIKGRFLEDYEKYIDESKTRLGDMFNEHDYPHPSHLKERFYFESTCQPLPDMDSVEMFVSGDELQGMKTQLEKDMLDNVNKNQRGLWENMYKTISRMADKCSKEIGSKGSVFRDKHGRGMVSDLVKLCELIPKKDILGDNELELIRKDVEEKLLVNPDDLKSDPVKREEIAEKASGIMDAMVGYMGYKPETAEEKKSRTESITQQWVESKAKDSPDHCDEHKITNGDLAEKAQRFAKYF